MSMNQFDKLDNDCIHYLVENFLHGKKFYNILQTAKRFHILSKSKTNYKIIQYLLKQKFEYLIRKNYVDVVINKLNFKFNNHNIYNYQKLYRKLNKILYLSLKYNNTVLINGIYSKYE